MVKADDFVKALQLTVLSPSTKKEWDIRTTDINRPGMQLFGFYEYFAYERPQVIGKVEMTYIESLDSDERGEVLRKYFSYDLPCVIICRGMMPTVEMIEEAKALDLVILGTDKTTYTTCGILYSLGLPGTEEE